MAGRGSTGAPDAAGPGEGGAEPDAADRGGAEPDSADRGGADPDGACPADAGLAERADAASAEGTDAALSELADASSAERADAVRQAAMRRRLIDDIFGDVLPGTTSDERVPGQHGGFSRAHYEASRPPHWGTKQ